jgi:YfiH family protein
VRVRGPDPIELELSGARVAFSTRNGGVSDGPYRSLNLGILTDDDPARVTDNRRRLAGSVGLAPESVAMVWQVHGGELAEWTEPPRSGGYAVPGAPLRQVDGHLTDLPGVGLLILGADCLPVALAGPRRVSMLHCGWRGLAAGILTRGATATRARAAAVGPGIGRCCYEVSEEVIAEFAELGEGIATGRMLDLAEITLRQLDRAGVAEVETTSLCTSCHPELFFSHRRDRGRTGRQAGAAWPCPG